MILVISLILFLIFWCLFCVWFYIYGEELVIIRFGSIEVCLFI